MNNCERIDRMKTAVFFLLVVGINLVTLNELALYAVDKSAQSDPTDPVARMNSWEYHVKLKNESMFRDLKWRTVKVEEVYLRDYQTVAEARYNLSRYFELYNNQRLYQALGYRTPAEVYGVAVGTPVALRAPSVPTALTYGDESTLKTCSFCLGNG